MSGRFRIIVCALVISSVTGIGGCRIASHVQIQPSPPPPTRAEMIGTWLGLFPSSATRLDLRADGSAKLIVAVGTKGGSVRQYESDHWELTDHALSIVFLPTDEGDQTVYFNAMAHHGGLSRVSISILSVGGAPIEGPLTPVQTIRVWRDALGF